MVRVNIIYFFFQSKGDVNCQLFLKTDAMPRFVLVCFVKKIAIVLIIYMIKIYNFIEGYCIKHETYTQLKQINQIKDDHKVGVHVQGRSDDNCCKKNESSSVCFQIYIQGGLVTSSCLPARHTLLSFFLNRYWIC